MLCSICSRLTCIPYIPRISSKSISKLYPHQVGGHGLIHQKTPGQIIKPTNSKEFAFYNYVNDAHLPARYLWIRQVIPRFYGEHCPSLPDSDDEEPNNKVEVCLEDINEQFMHPCILDCKIGQRQYDDDDIPEKQKRAIAKCNSTTSAQFGIRITGAQCYKTVLNEYESHDRKHGRSLKGEDLIPEMMWFFSDGIHLRRRTVELVLERIRFIGEEISSQTHFRFYSSSLLIVYEGDINLPTRVDVRMIDFAKTHWDNGEVDKGYMLGINTLMQLLETILNQGCARPLV